MAISLSKEDVCMKFTVAQTTFQTLVEGDAIVPDVKPDIGQVLQAEGTVLIHKQEALQDRIVTGGTVLFTVLYVPEDQPDKIKSIRTSYNFSHTADVAGVRSGQKVTLYPDVEHVEANIIHSRKLNLKAVVGISAQVTEKRNFEFVSAIDDPNVQSLSQTVKVSRVLGESSEQITIKEEMELENGKATIGELLRTDFKISGKDARVMQNKVFIKGDLNVCMLYQGELLEDGIQFVEQSIPFTEVFSIEGVTEGAPCELDFQIQDLTFEPKDDGDGELRILSVNAVIQASVMIEEEIELQSVVDCYHTEEELTFKQETIEYNQTIEDIRGQVTVRETAHIPDNSPGISDVYHMVTKSVISDVSIDNGKMLVEGVVDAYLLCLTDNPEQPVTCHKKELPFTYQVDVKNLDHGVNTDVTVEVSHDAYNLSGSRDVEIKAVVSLSAKVLKPIATSFMTDISVMAGTQTVLPSPSIMIYYVQTGDSLWKIARKYKTTEDDIVSLNDTVRFDTLNVGQQLFIPRKCKRECKI